MSNSYKLYKRLLTFEYLWQDKNVKESDQPRWMSDLRTKLQDSRTSRNVKLFICKLIVNTQQVGQHHYYPHYIIIFWTLLLSHTIWLLEIEGYLVESLQINLVKYVQDEIIRFFCVPL